MKLFCVLILALLEIEARTFKPASRRHLDLARLIHLVVHQNDEVDRAEDAPNFVSADYYMSRGERLGPEAKDSQARDFRLLVIKNPRVLEEFKKKIHEKSYIGWENGESIDDRYNLDRRRNAVFRLDSSSIEKSLRTKADENMMVINRKESLERRRLDKDDKRDRNNVDAYDKEALRSKKRREDVTQDRDRNGVDAYKDAVRKKRREDVTHDTWDVITKKYDWDEPKRKKDKSRTTEEWNKITHQDFDEWDMKTTKKREENRMKPKIDLDSRETKHKIQKQSDSYERPKKAPKDWDNVTVKTTQWKSGKVKSWNKPYVPKISSYESPRQKKRDNNEGGFFGRTPIPYVGRHGIYAD